MHSIQFWRSWQKPYQFLFFFCSAVAAALILFFWYSWFIQPGPAITWDHYQQFRRDTISLYTFTQTIYDLVVSADNHFVYEHISPSGFQPQALSFYLLTVALAIGFTFLISIISQLKKYWFFIGMGLVILFIISLRLETVELFGLTGKQTAIAVLVLYVGTAFYFNALQPHVTFIIRLTSFAGITAAFGILIAIFSHVEYPFLHLAVNGLIPGVLLTVVFILMAANEILSSFVWITSQRGRNHKSLRNFLIIALIYLLNIGLGYVVRMGFLKWDIILINLFFLFTISAVLAIWGFRHREPQYNTILSADPLGVYLILSLLIVSFGVLSFLVSTASDTMVKTIQDVIVFAHLGYGFIFFIYVLVNFGGMLADNLAVYKVLYKPNSMPYFTARLMGLIATFVCLSYATSYQAYIDRATAAYYNAYGDLYYLAGNDVVAEAYYNKSVIYRNQNHHAHFALASIFTARLDPLNEKTELTKACEETPSPEAFMSLSDAYQQSDNWLGSILVLEEGMHKFPDNGILKNALGLAQAQFKAADSALYFFQQARRIKDVKNEADINFLALTAQNKVAFPADSLLQILGSDKPGAIANALALANAQHKSLDVNFTLSTDTALNVYQAVLISNELINKKDNIDSAIISSIEKLARRPVNLNFREALLAAASQAWYAQGQVRRASETIRELAYNTNNGKYFQLLGLWLLEQNNPATAANYFKIGIEKETPMAPFYKAIAETQQGNLAEAAAEWSTLPKEGEAGALATRTLKIINSTPTEIAVLSDPDKYAYSRYKINLTDTALFNTVVNSIQEPQWKARAVYDRAAQWFEQDEPDRAIAYLSALKGITFQDNNLYNDIMRLSALIAADRQNWQGLESQLDKIPFNSFHRTEKIYLQALLDEAKGKDADAKTKYQYLSQANLQFEDALVASSRYLASDTTDRLKAYSILVNGLLAKPNSIKLLKAYVKYAAFLGFDDEAQRSLDLLRTLLPPPSFNKYVRQNPDFFSTESNGQK